MVELLRTNDIVFLSFAEAALRAEGLSPVILDAQASIMDGSLIAIQRRLMAPDHEEVRARAVLDTLAKEYGPF
jgi:hypothetical protein